MLNLKEYFETMTGHGVLATADRKGNVDAALYARPHVMEDGSIAFIMAHHLSYQNLTANPKAAYLFIESGEKKSESDGGIRLYLTRIREEKAPQLVVALRRKQRDDDGADRSVVYFSVDRVRPLTGE
ncbi:MAG: pyridoxamine 5'-phosphate oxidase family protein [Candidatus Latescibacterota bacterium]